MKNSDITRLITLARKANELLETFDPPMQNGDGEIERGKHAVSLLQRIAKEYPPESFLNEDHDCLFCGWVEYESGEHAPDCIAMLIQEFKVD